MNDQELANFRDALVSLIERKIDGRNVDVMLLIADRDGDGSVVATTYQDKYDEQAPRVSLVFLYVLLQELSEVHPVVLQCRNLIATEFGFPMNDNFIPIN